MEAELLSKSTIEMRPSAHLGLRSRMTPLRLSMYVVRLETTVGRSLTKEARPPAEMSHGLI